MCCVLQDGEPWGLFESEFITLHVAAMWGSGSVKLQVWGGDAVESLQGRVSLALQVSVDQKWSELTLHSKVRGKYEQLQSDYSLSYYFKAGSEHEVKVGCMLRGGGSKGVKKQHIKGTAPAGAGAKKKKTKPQDDDDDENEDEGDSNDEDDDMDNSSGEDKKGESSGKEGMKSKQLLKQISKNLAVIKATPKGTVFKRYTDMMEEFMKCASDGEAEGVFIKLLESVPSQKLKGMFELKPASTRNLPWLQSHLSKTYFYTDLVNTADELKEHSALIVSMMSNMVGCAYLLRYRKTGKATYGVLVKSIASILERRATPAAAPQSFLGRVFHHV